MIITYYETETLSSNHYVIWFDSKAFANFRINLKVPERNVHYALLIYQLKINTV